ncbi:helix-turn-helix domain-containing protein [Rhodobaculum claviforme]|uniref:HTH cro/C1-type domain-containing protein n=1 Tax=Rhodobaculum claviforme TaxID=1549854 RepID=A0A934TJD5_9RHOB|nr:helix-turn-helix domain-containing protein [Rhodobaculum claviforme]MBK5927169.1 hypothetical protein [Rhodobaculum claviforme]
MFVVLLMMLHPTQELEPPANPARFNPNVPPIHFGRLGWFTKQLEDRGKTVTQETVRKWFSGESYPRKATMTLLASVLGVDEAWLAVGQSGVPDKQKKIRNATADGAVNLLAGLIQMDGAHPSFPSDNDRKAANHKIDLHAIIKGALYNFHVSLGQQSNRGWLFSIPVEALSETVIIGVMSIGNLQHHFVELDAEGIEAVGKRKGGTVEVLLPNDEVDWNLRRITSFAERL